MEVYEFSDQGKEGLSLCFLLIVLELCVLLSCLEPILSCILFMACNKGLFLLFHV